jgi:AraC family transcriptional regulator of arabinose operon
MLGGTMFEIERMGCHYKEPATFKIDRPTGSGNYLLLLFLSDILIREDGEKRHHESGTAILYTPGVPQFYHQPFSGFDNDWIHFVGDDVGEFLKVTGFPINTPFQTARVNEIHGLIRRIEQESLMKNKHYERMVDLLIRETLLQLARSASGTTTESSDYPKMEEQFRKARSTILSQLEKDWSIENMAALLNLSTSRFSHIYSQIFHISPKKDLITERMNMACFLIQSQSYSNSEVARKVGYDNLYHFSKQFKAVTGKAPSEYA